jgi:O-antigen ligase
MELYDFDYSHMVLAGWLCLMASIFFAFRRPAANAFLNLTFVGVGGAPLLPGFTYARLSALVAFCTILRLLIRPKQVGAVRLKFLSRTPLAWFAAVCLAILAKILIDTVIYGYDESRAVNLQVGLTELLFPVVVVLMALVKDGQEATAHDILLGMAIFPVLMLVGYLPFTVNNGLLLSAWNGTTRFSLGSADTINSARVMTCGIVGSLLFFSMPGKQGIMKKFLAPALVLGFLLLVLLNGNRQFLLALIAFLILWAFLLQESKLKRWIVGSFTLAFLVLIMHDVFTSSHLALKDRLSAETIETDAAEGRGEIWSDAFESVLKHPMLGTGFKNFGREMDAVDRSGQVVTVRDSAHGVFQDVFTEHGVILGLAFLAGCFHLIRRSWRVFRQKRISADKALTAGLLALLLPLLFSGSFLDATPVFLLLLLAMARDTQRLRSGNNQKVPMRQRKLQASAKMCHRIGQKI